MTTKTHLRSSGEPSETQILNMPPAGGEETTQNPRKSSNIQRIEIPSQGHSELSRVYTAYTTRNPTLLPRILTCLWGKTKSLREPLHSPALIKSQFTTQ